MEKLFVVQRPNGTHIGAYSKKEWAEDEVYKFARWFEGRFGRLPSKTELPSVQCVVVDVRDAGKGMN